MLVVAGSTGVVSVAIYFDVDVGIRNQDSGNLGEPFPGLGFKGRAVQIEEHIRHVYDQALCGVFGLKYLVELTEQALPHLFLFALGLL